MSHRALITGITGFAGSFLAEHLLASGDAVLGVSFDGRWTDICPAALQRAVALVSWNVADEIPADARRTIDDFAPDFVYHLAAISVPGDCGEGEPTPNAMAINVDGTRRVLELAAELSRPPKVVFTSSSQVYSPTGGNWPRVDEDHPLAPRRAYGYTKLLAENEVRRAVGEGRCQAVIVRSFQHAGPRQNDRMMLSQWARQLATDTGVVEVITRDAIVDLTDVRDVIRAYRLLAQRGANGGVYNVGSGVGRRSGEILDVLCGMARPDVKIVELRPGFKQDPIADTSRLARETGWQPTIPLEQTVADTYRWWRDRHLQSRNQGP